MRILVIGASGMIGNAVLRVLSEKSEWEVFGTVRDERLRRFFPAFLSERLRTGVDVLCQDALVKTLDQIRPDVVVNCAGLTKQKPNAHDPLIAIPINTLMPHRLAALCKLAGVRLIHISTDCVFSGDKGGYVETDPVDARDVYGKSKALGEINSEHAITLRVSTIGHELQSQFGLLDWFLSQEGRCRGFTRAIFSGLPTVVFAQIVRDVVIPREELFGVYHVAGKPIAKSDLLRLIADVYGKTIDIVSDDSLVVDRSLDAKRFQMATGYVAAEWPAVIQLMHSHKTM